jgi:membrane protein
MGHIPLKEIAPLCRVAFQNWQDDRAPRMGAALAYYIALSLAPTVLILLGIAGWAFGAQAAEGRMVSQIQDFVGYQGAKAIQTMIEGARPSSKGIAASVLGIVTVFFAAAAVVSELRDAMNTIWRVPEDTTSSTVGSIFNLVKERLVSFALVLASGSLLVMSLIVNAWISAVAKYLSWGSGEALEILVRTIDWAFTFVAITALFAFIFKVLPEAPVEWGDVAHGAVVTAILFTAGKVLLGLYLGRTNFTGTYGAAGSLVIVLVWVYYSAQMFYLGAEFTRVYACRFGSMGANKNGVISEGLAPHKADA